MRAHQAEIHVGGMQKLLPNVLYHRGLVLECQYPWPDQSRDFNEILSHKMENSQGSIKSEFTSPHTLGHFKDHSLGLHETSLENRNLSLRSCNHTDLYADSHDRVL